MNIECPGLDGSNPLHFLAAVGVLRLLPGGSKMAWQFHGAWNPVYEFDGEGKEFYATLSQRIRLGVPDHPPIAQTYTQDGSAQRIQPDPKDLAKIRKAYSFISKWDVPKVNRGEFRTASRYALDIVSTKILDPMNTSWVLASLNAESLPNDKGELEPSAFSFSNGGGQQFLLKDFLTLVSLVSPPAFECTLQGTPDRFLCCTSLNWDPMSFRAYAYQWAEPESQPKETDVAANVLAFAGLGFFPTVPRSNGNFTLGYNESERAFRWPIWEHREKCDVIESILGQPLFNHTDPYQRGFSAVFESRRFSSNKRLYFTPSRSV